AASVPSNAKFTFRPVVSGGEVVKKVSSTVESTVHSWTSGGASRWPFSPTARTRKTWTPSERPAYIVGEKHSTKGSPSSEHSNDAVTTVEANRNSTLGGEVSPGSTVNDVTPGPLGRSQSSPSHGHPP